MDKSALAHTTTSKQLQECGAMGAMEKVHTKSRKTMRRAAPKKNNPQKNMLKETHNDDVVVGRVVRVAGTDKFPSIPFQFWLFK